MTKEIYGEQEKILTGLNRVTDAVKSTMGGEGNTVIIYDDEGIKFTKDGVTVARAINLEDSKENMGAQIVINSAEKTVDEVGDGTTATAVLLQSMVKNAIREDEEINDLIEEMESTILEVKKSLEEKSREVTTIDEIRNIASISSNSEDIGDLIAEVYREVGFDSLVTLERARYNDKIVYDVTKGLEFGSGMLSSAFANDSSGRCIFEDAFIHVENKEVRDAEKFGEAFKESMQNDIPIVIIAPKFSTSFAQRVSFNINHGNLRACLIKTPGFGDGIKQNIKDIKAFLSEDNMVDKIVITPSNFYMYNENPHGIQERVDQLRERIKYEDELYFVRDYTERIHRLQNSTAVIFVGGKTEQSASEEYDRVEDALGSVKSAIKQGFVEGGGLALYNESKAIDGSSRGSNIIKKSIQEPIKQILRNANEPVDVILSKVGDKGYNVKTREYEDFMVTGVIDPTKVVIASLENAFASCKLLINNKYSIINK